MLIFGTTGITKTSGTGTFHCPSCSAAQAYRMRRVRRFFTLYFIPLIPLDRVGEYVECGQCKEKYHARVLSLDPETQNAQAQSLIHEAIRRTMVLVSLADGSVDDAEVETIRQLYAQLSGTEMSHNEIHAEVESLQRSGADIEHALGDITHMLNEHGKELVVRAALMVAAADGTFDAGEQALIQQIAQVLQMSAAHINGIVASMAAAGEGA